MMKTSPTTKRKEVESVEKKVWYVYASRTGISGYVQQCTKKEAQKILEKLRDFALYCWVDFLWYSDVKRPVQEVHGKNVTQTDDILAVFQRFPKLSGN
jgi:hypothetical protein